MHENANVSRLYFANLIRHGPTMIICMCKALNERQLRESIASGATSFEELQMETGVSTCCGACTETVHSLLAGHAGGAGLAATELRRAAA